MLKKAIRNINIPLLFCFSFLILGAVVYSASMSKFTLTINPGTLIVDIVDESYNSILSPAVALDPILSSMSCLTAYGTLGTTTERIYIQNPDAVDDGWSASLAAESPTDSWIENTDQNIGFDFNDSNNFGCSNSGFFGGETEIDYWAGQMTINPSTATISTGKCQNCNTTNISLGNENSFTEGSINSITLATGSQNSSKIGDWVIQGIEIKQTIPAGQPVGDYSIDMTLSILGLGI